jgi:hypothetical protein
MDDCGTHLANRNTDAETPQRMLGGRRTNGGINSVKIAQLDHVLRQPAVGLDSSSLGW